MNPIRILFLGASKRVSLLERFEKAAISLETPLEIFSCESDDRFCPISDCATILPGPKFLTEEFQAWLTGTVFDRGIEIVIPTMDSATVALSRWAQSGPRKCWSLVSEQSLCEQMHDKYLADAFFRAHRLPVPPNTPGRFPKIAKGRFGFGAKDIHVVRDQHELERAIGRHRDGYLVQDLIVDNLETTVDFYLSPRQGLMGYVIRDRLEISDGEVMVCRTRRPEPDERDLIESVAGIPGWQGCITLQYVRDQNGKLYIVEVNPRFGGGATCSMEAGLDMAHYILSEWTGHRLVKPAQFRNLIMSRARRDFFREY